MKRRANLFPYLFCLALAGAGYLVWQRVHENAVLRQVIERLSAESRVAHVLVTGVTADAATGRPLTEIKFLEFDTAGRPLEPKYFRFSGNVIQFQSLVIRFDDALVRSGHPLKGKSACIFMKAFCLDADPPQVFEINRAREIPTGYEVEGKAGPFERRLWQEFWTYALDPGRAARIGVKNAQLEAPGTRFVPGMVYTLNIEHDGGLRIDSQQLPAILKGERLNF